MLGALVARLLHPGEKARRLLRYQKQLARQELLIVDELGFLPIEGSDEMKYVTALIHQQWVICRQMANIQFAKHTKEILNSTSVKPRARIAAFTVFTVAYFFFFTWQGLRLPFAADDLMNLAGHWRPGPWRLFYSNFLLWHDFYRPMGGLFYVPIFHFFGLNAAAYHAALLPLLLLLVGLVYLLARILGASRLEAWLAALVVSCHAGLAFLYFETIYIYDVFCAIFYAGALLCYVRARSRGRLLSASETALFFALFLCALNSKEMAVTLSVMLLAYEWLYHRPGSAPPQQDSRDRVQLLRRFVVPGISAVMTAVFIYGRVWRGLGRQPGYLVGFSLTRLASFQQRQFQDIFVQPDYGGGWALVALSWLLVTYFAWRRNRPLLRFFWIWILVTPLPLEFLDGRRKATLAIPLIGWAILGAAAALALARSLSNSMECDPGFRRLSPQTRLAAVVAVLVAAWASWNGPLFESVIQTYHTGIPTGEVIQQFQALNPTVRPHSTVVFLNDPFDSWDMAFVAELWFHDRTVIIHLEKKTPLTAAELARVDYLFDWRNGKLIPAGGAATISQSQRR